MLEFSNGGRLVQDVSELPNLRGCRNVFADYETTSGNPKKKALNPWEKTCDIAGLGITADDAPGAWYIPIAHCEDLFTKINLPRHAVAAWLADIRKDSERWINHNVKFDAHLEQNFLGVELPERIELVCSLTAAKIHDSSRMFGYELDELSKRLLGQDISGYGARLQPYLGRKNYDYGRIPPDVLGAYGCQDVLTNRHLYNFYVSQMPSDNMGTWDVEKQITRLLLDVERFGLRVLPIDLKKAEYIALARMVQIDEQLSRIVGRSFRPHVADDCFEVLCNQYGLPVVGWTQEDEDGSPAGNPSFDKAALRKYLAHPNAPQRVVELIMEYRKLSTKLSFFIQPFQERSNTIDGRIHPTYNQRVRTGRLSCKEPNAQQLDHEAKQLIVPDEGFEISSFDYSQIEFRFIAHYINDYSVLKAFNEDPNSDFHDLVASLCGISRQPAKTMNFLMGYGGGKPKATKQLSFDLDLVADLKEKVRQYREQGRIAEGKEQETFERLAKERASDVYDRYHEMLPSLKPTARRAAKVAELRGYVKNIYGCRRALAKSDSYKAFNSVCQSSAAELMKRRMVALMRYVKEHKLPYQIIAQVHDDLVGQSPPELFDNPQVVEAFRAILQEPECEFSLPIVTKFKRSTVSWGDC